MKVGCLVVNYRVIIKERATRYKHAKACNVIISHNRQELYNSYFNIPLRTYSLIGET